jgi:hypothetical protein
MVKEKPKTITFRCDEEFQKRIKKFANNIGVSVSELITESVIIGAKIYAAELKEKRTRAVLQLSSPDENTEENTH